MHANKRGIEFYNEVENGLMLTIDLNDTLGGNVCSSSDCCVTKQYYRANTSLFLITLNVPLWFNWQSLPRYSSLKDYQLLVCFQVSHFDSNVIAAICRSHYNRVLPGSNLFWAVVTMKQLSPLSCSNSHSDVNKIHTPTYFPMLTRFTPGQTFRC